MRYKQTRTDKDVFPLSPLKLTFPVLIYSGPEVHESSEYLNRGPCHRRRRWSTVNAPAGCGSPRGLIYGPGTRTKSEPVWSFDRRSSGVGTLRPLNKEVFTGLLRPLFLPFRTVPGTKRALCHRVPTQPGSGPSPVTVLPNTPLVCTSTRCRRLLPRTPTRVWRIRGSRWRRSLLRN